MGGQQRIDDEFFGYLTLNQRAIAMAEQGLHRLLQVPKGGGHAPNQ